MFPNLCHAYSGSSNGRRKVKRTVVYVKLCSGPVLTGDSQLRTAKGCRVSVASSRSSPHYPNQSRKRCIRLIGAVIPRGPTMMDDENGWRAARPGGQPTPSAALQRTVHLRPARLRKGDARQAISALPAISHFPFLPLRTLTSVYVGHVNMIDMKGSKGVFEHLTYFTINRCCCSIRPIY